MASLSSYSSSSSSRCSQKHHVFLSFRGEDTRAKFTSHLEAMLRVKSIDAYIDNRLEKGEGISKALLEAIRGSKMSIVVFSVNYATSSWCLDEVVCIVECMRERGQVVVPVFYEVEPSNVRKQSGSYKTAFSALEERFPIEKVDEWKAALKDVASLSGFPSSNFGTDAELVEAIVNDTLKKLNCMSGSGHFKGLVGMENSVEGMKNLLWIGSSDVRFIGIWGMGGLGKTTLARVMFDILASDFEARCFLDNVREQSEKLGLEELRKKLFSELLGEKDFNHISSFHEERLCCMKVLIVLDDVDQPVQLDYLAGDHEWFGAGSRIIITTRDDQVLRDRADGKYELQGLDDEFALELFKMYAFKRTSPTSDDIDLSKIVVRDYCKGIPLALKVLGSFLRSKRREYWEDELKGLKVAPHKTVQVVLKISYDGLSEQEQRVFLDIVCFVNVYKGTCRHFVERILGGDSRLKSVIESIIDKSLIINDHNSLRMHDLITDMGRQIVRQQYVEEPGKRSRLWNKDDCYRVLQGNTGTENIEGISLMDEVADVSHGNFSKMHKLRYLAIVPCNLELTQESPFQLSIRIRKPIDYAMTEKLNHQFEYLPSTLKYVEWCRWPFTSMPRNFSPENLVELRMPYSRLERLWNGDQELGNLKHVDLSWSFWLTDVSALSQDPNLESVILFNCKNLNQVPSLSFGGLDKRHHRCSNERCRTLGHLNLKACFGLQVISRISGYVKRLELSHFPVKEFLPELIGCVTSLEELVLSYSITLEHLPKSILEFEYLRHLSLRCCKISNIPIGIGCLSFLEELDLSENPICEIPREVKKLCKLRILQVNNCKDLTFLPDLPLSLEYVGACGCGALRIVSFPMNVLLQRESWTDYYVTRNRHFLFHGSPLDQKTRDMLCKQFDLRVVRTAAARALNSIMIDEGLLCPDILVSFPGNEIPEWFLFQKKGDFICVQRYRRWEADFLGFALAFVTEKEAFDQVTYHIQLVFRSKNNAAHVSPWSFEDKYLSRGSNLVLFYKYLNDYPLRDINHVDILVECDGKAKVIALLDIRL